MEKLFIIFKWLAAMILLVVILLFTNSRQDHQTIYLNNVMLVESQDKFIDEQMVLDYLQDESIFFDSILVTDFSKEKLENVLQSHPAVKQVEVFGSQKGDINILIEQKRAVVRLKGDNGDYYLDEFGKRMELSANYTPKLVVVTGEFSVKDHAGIYEFISNINKSEFWYSQITQIHFEKDEVLLIPRVGSHKVNIGSFNDIVNKLDNLYQFYKLAMPKKGWNTYSNINLEFENQIVCLKK